MKHRALLAGACTVASLCLAGAAFAQQSDQNPEQGNNYQQGQAMETQNTPARASEGQPVSPQHLHRNGAPANGSVLMEQARMYQPPGSFLLTSDQQTEVADFSSPRDLSVCVARPTAFAQMNAKERPGDRDASIPLDVSWHGRTATVQPGNCLSFDAARVKVSPAQPIPSGDALHGQIRTLGRYSD